MGAQCAEPVARYAKLYDRSHLGSRTGKHLELQASVSTRQPEIASTLLRCSFIYPVRVVQGLPTYFVVVEHVRVKIYGLVSVKSVNIDKFL